jgi:protein-L-isoaspartate(D-aspartate) O-methyltransferase
MSEYAGEREWMVEQHLRRRGITDERVLAAMRRVPREWFVPPELRERSYADSAVSIGAGQTISQPYIVALTTQALEAAPGHRVLEIGTGSGYQTAILAELGAEVFTIERIAALSLRARGILDAQGYDHIHFRIGDGTLGWPDEAPFDRIVVTAMAPELPQALFRQLRETGRMVMPIGMAEQQRLELITKSAGKPVSHVLCGCLFVKLIGEQGWSEGDESRE